MLSRLIIFNIFISKDKPFLNYETFKWSLNTSHFLLRRSFFITPDVMEKVKETKVVFSDQEIDEAMRFLGKISACKMSSCPGIMQAKAAFAVFCRIILELNLFLLMWKFMIQWHFSCSLQWVNIRELWSKERMPLYELIRSVICKVEAISALEWFLPLMLKSQKHLYAVSVCLTLCLNAVKLHPLSMKADVSELIGCSCA